MKKAKGDSISAAKLRRRAEELLRQSRTEAPSPATAQDSQRLLHELQVHQIELEIQNEELVDAQQKLEETLEQYTELYDFAPVGYFTVEHDGTIRRVNLAGARLLGAERSALVNGRLQFFVAHKDRSTLNAFLSGTCAGKVRQSCELALGNNDTPTRHVHVEATAARDGQSCRLMMLDVTARLRAEQALRHGEERYRRIVETANEGIAAVDLQDRITYANQRLADMLGYGIDEIIGQSTRILVFEDDLAEQPQLLDPRRLGEHATQERRFRRKDGSTLWTIVSATAMHNEEGEFAGAFAMFTDITELRRANQERLEMEHNLQQAQKLESLGVLAGGIAHDFNNLLTAVLGNLELAERRLAPDSSLRTHIMEAFTAAQRGADLTRQMLTYVGRAHVVIANRDVSTLVEEHVEMLRSAISRNVTLSLHLDHALPPIKADASQIQQVIVNLITNAAEAIQPETGVVTLTTGLCECDEAYLAHSRVREKPDPGRFVFLEVSDTGCGMDAETQERLFDPFFTTKFTGRGLGMSAVLGIVDSHRGAIMVTSEPDQGTVVRILFPAIELEEVAETTPSPPVPAATVAPAGGLLLIVDDEEMLRTLCSRMVQILGYRYITACNGPEALDLLSRYGKEIQAVVLDLTMPLMDGFATFKQMRAIEPDVKIILASGFSKEDATRRFQDGDLVGFLQKPYRLETLEAILARLSAGT